MLNQKQFGVRTMYIAKKAAGVHTTRPFFLLLSTGE